MATHPPASLNVDRYVVIHVATTCDEHGVYVTKDSAEVIEIGWILVDAKTLEEVRTTQVSTRTLTATSGLGPPSSSRAATGARATGLILFSCLVATPRKHPRQARQHPDNSSV